MANLPEAVLENTFHKEEEKDYDWLGNIHSGECEAKDRRIAEIAARREPIKTIDGLIEHFDVLLLEENWLIAAASHHELGLVVPASIYVPEIGMTLRVPGGGSDGLRKPAMVGPQEITIDKSSERFIIDGEDLDVLTGSDIKSGQRLWQAKILFEHGRNKMPKQKYIEFYSPQANDLIKSVNIKYAADGLSAVKDEILYDEAIRVPIARRRAEATLKTDTPERIDLENPYLTTSTGVLMKRFRPEHTPERVDDDKYTSVEHGCKDVLEFGDEHLWCRTVSKIHTWHEYGRCHQLPFGMLVEKYDPLTAKKVAGVNLHHNKDQLVLLGWCEFFNFQTGELESSVKFMPAQPY